MPNNVSYKTLLHLMLFVVLLIKLSSFLKLKPDLPS